MNGITIPAILAGLGLLAAIGASRLIRRGAARFYALERDAMLRRAVMTLSASVLLFLISIGLLVNTQLQLTAVPEDEAGAEAGTSAGTLAEPTEVVIESLPPRATEDTSIILSQPPTISAEPTIDLTLPTAEPTPVIIRAVIEGTAGSGANLREAPSVNSAELEVLDDGTIVTLIEGSIPVDANNFTWVNIRTGSGQDGWVVDVYLTINNR